MPNSNYSVYSNQKHLQVDERDDSILGNVYLFLMLTIPQTIAIALILRCIFLKIWESPFSIYLRKFYFLPPTILQALFEGNLAYFTYLAFNKLFNASFSFAFVDKVDMALSVVLLFLCMVYSFSFFFLISHFYKKQAGYYLHSAYRCEAGLLALMIKFPVRGMLRGFFFSFFYNLYGWQIFSLSLIEAAVVICLLAVEACRGVFIKKNLFCMYILYHVAFIVLNLALYLERIGREEEEEEL